MPTFGFRLVEITGSTLFSFLVNSEGIFLFITPFELAILWPWSKE